MGETASEHEQNGERQAAKLSVPTSVTPPGAESFELPALPEWPTCQNCGVGYLTPIGFDADAKHEEQPRTPQGDPKGHAHFLASGGALWLRCFICEQTQTQPYGADPDERAASVQEQETQASIDARMARQG